MSQPQTIHHSSGDRNIFPSLWGSAILLTAVPRVISVLCNAELPTLVAGVMTTDDILDHVRQKILPDTRTPFDLFRSATRRVLMVRQASTRLSPFGKCVAVPFCMTNLLSRSSTLSPINCPITQPWTGCSMRLTT